MQPVKQVKEGMHQGQTCALGRPLVLCVSLPPAVPAMFALMRAVKL